MRPPQDSTGRPIGVGDRVSWRGQLYMIKSFGDPVGRFGTRAITFEEPLHVSDEVPDEIAVDLVEAAPSMSTTEDAPKTRCPWCKGDCRRWGLETCPFRPRQIPRPREDGKVAEPWRPLKEPRR